MAINNKAIFLIKHFEGLRLDVYRDNKGFPTVGYGSLVSGLPAPFNTLQIGQRITEQQADTFMHSHLQKSGITKYLDGLDLDENKKAAMCSFFYHHGLNHPSTKSIFEKNALSYWSMQKWFFDNWDNNNWVLKERNFQTVHYYHHGALLPRSSSSIRQREINAALSNDEVILKSVTKKKK